MIASDGQMVSIAHTIQLAVAPVFLLAGIGSMLGVLTNRLARIVDKARKLEDSVAGVDPTMPDIRRSADLRILARRARYAQVAIGCFTLCALLVALVVMVLFTAAIFDLNAFAAVAMMFIAAMSVFIVGLLSFLREIHLALANTRIGPQPEA